MINKSKKLAAIITGNLFFLPISLLAGGLQREGGNGGGGSGGTETGVGSSKWNPLGVIESIPELLNNIIGYLLATALIVAPIMIIWGAFQMLLSAGDPAKFKNGQKTIVFAVIGLIIILLAKGMAAIIEKVFTG